MEISTVIWTGIVTRPKQGIFCWINKVKIKSILKVWLYIICSSSQFTLWSDSDLRSSVLKLDQVISQGNKFDCSLLILLVRTAEPTIRNCSKNKNIVLFIPRQFELVVISCRFISQYCRFSFFSWCWYAFDILFILLLNLTVIL